MAHHVTKTLLLLTALTSVNAYWLMGAGDFITTERLDPIVNPGKVSGHVHSVVGGSNFGMNINTAQLRQSQCTSIPIAEDKSSYWFPHLYFQWNNGSFSSLNGGTVIYYLFNDKPGTTTAFPDDFRMLSGDPTLRTYDPNSHAQQAITFLCLNFNGVTSRHNSLPAKVCPDGVRAQVNFPSCWNGKDLDSPDHKSHVAFLSGGPDSGTCSDPNFPYTLPRIFIEVYWATSDFEKYRSQAMNPSQPLVYAYGDPTGYGYHADFANGWDKGVLQRAVDNCHCNMYGDPTCCGQQGIFTYSSGGSKCHITKGVNEQTTGMLPKLPGNNPVQKEGTKATMYSDPNPPNFLSPVYAYTGNTPPAAGKPVIPDPGHSSSAATSSVVTSSVVIPPLSSSTRSASSVTLVHPSPSPSSTVLPPASSHNSPSQAPSSASQVLPSAPPSGSSASGNDTPTPSPSAPSHSAPSPSVSSISSSSTRTHTPSMPYPSTSSIIGGGSTHSPTVSAPATSPTSTGGDGDDDDEDGDDEDCDDDDDDEGDEEDAPPSTPNTPPPSSGSGSNHDSSDHSDHAPPDPVPATTFVVGGGQGTAVPQSPAPTGVFVPVPVSHSADTCPGGKFRHKYLREKMQAKEQKRSDLHHARNLHSRFMRPHSGAF